MYCLCAYLAVFTVFYFAIIGFPVLVQCAHGQPENVPLYVSDLGRQFTHFDTVTFFILGFPFNL